MECTFVVGQKVICVKPANHLPDVNVPVVGETYTVREVFSVRGEGIGIRLTEIRNDTVMSPHGVVGELGFRPYSFRPVTDLLAEFMAKRKQKTPRVKETQC